MIWEDGQDYDHVSQEEVSPVVGHPAEAAAQGDGHELGGAWAWGCYWSLVGGVT